MMVSKAEQLTLFAADSLDPASLSVLPGSKEAKKMTVTSGRKCSELLKNSDPVGCLVKMLLVSSEWHSTKCLLTWKVKATPRYRLLFQLAVSTLRTEETEFSSWAGDANRAIYFIPTPRSVNITTSEKAKTLYKSSPGLADYVKMWPTPTVNGNYNQKGMSKNSGDGLATAVKMWPTPTSRDHKDGTAESCQNVPVNSLLGRAVHLYPTPTASCHQNPGIHGQGGQNLVTEVFQRETGEIPTSGSLNPAWVELLMGFPPGWTETSN